MQLEEKQISLSPAGDLVIDLRPVCETRLRYTPWDKGLRLYREFDGVWHEAAWDHRIPLVHAARYVAPDSPLNLFVSAIPESLRKIVRHFTHNQIRMLQWAARDSRMQDLLISSPVLYWLFVDAVQAKQWSNEKREAVIASKQPQILATLIGTGGKPMVRFLRKLSLLKGDRTERDLVLSALHQSEILLQSRHIETISIQSLFVLRKLPELRRADRVKLILKEIPPFFTISEAFSLTHRIIEEWHDTERLGNALGVQNVHAFMAQCHSRSSLRLLHNKWISCFNNRKQTEECSVSIVFPQPPLAGNEWIEPICTSRELRHEGRSMGHCVGSYEDKIASGHSYIYRVLQPERATLELKIIGSVPTIGQLRLKRNALPAPETEERVRMWLAGYTSQAQITHLARLDRSIQSFFRRSRRLCRGSNLHYRGLV